MGEEKDMPDRIRIGFVGAGGNARSHMGKFSKMPDTEIVAICDIKEDVVQSAVGQYGGKPYSDWRKMYKKEDMDALCISIPPYAHGKIELEAIKRGLHLFVEKPVALDLRTAEKIADAVEEKDLISSVGYQWRYLNTSNRSKEYLSDKNIGLVVGRYWSPFISGHAWWGVMQKSGGQVVEQATHIFDMTRFLAGNVEKVRAEYAFRGVSTAAGSDIPDASNVSMEFENGALGCVTVTCVLPKGWETGIDVMTGEGMLNWNAAKAVIPGPEENEIILEDKDGLSIDEAFIKAVKDNNPSIIKSPYRDALETLKVTLAANRSAKTGRTVKL